MEVSQKLTTVWTSDGLGKDAAIIASWVWARRRHERLLVEVLNGESIAPQGLSVRLVMRGKAILRWVFPPSAQLTASTIDQLDSSNNIEGCVNGAS